MRLYGTLCVLVYFGWNPLISHARSPNKLLKSLIAVRKFWLKLKMHICSLQYKWYHKKYMHTIITFSFIHFVGSNFSSCISSGKVISDIFCLPSNYRKEVPPKSKSNSVWHNIILLTLFQQMVPSMCSSSFQSQK